MKSVKILKMQYTDWHPGELSKKNTFHSTSTFYFKYARTYFVKETGF